jgi:HD-GYP domain-containing protein (c-di-GMP phosphodiesterase class II)
MYEEFFNECYVQRGNDNTLFHDLLESIARVVNLIEYKDTHHAERVALIALRLARKVGISDHSLLAQLYFAGLLHDVGEIGIPDALLYKKGKLSEEEFQVLTTHTAIGQQIVSQIPVLREAANLILWHHERWDGTGYPEGLTMDETPLMAQIVSLCDAFDSIRRGGLFSDPTNWENELNRFAGIQFNPHLVPPLVELTKATKAEDINRAPEDEAVIDAMESKEEVAQQLRQDYVVTIINFLLTLLEAKHKESAAHSRRVARLCEKMGERMRLNPIEQQTLIIAGYLHDIGKMGIPNSVMDKPGSLDDWEYQIVQKHPVHAATVLEPLRGFGDVVEAVLYHHERWDGSGYPEGMSGEDIPRLSRILHLCDLADAVTHLKRVPPREAIGRVLYVIEDGFGSYFDPDLSEYFEPSTIADDELEEIV